MTDDQIANRDLDGFDPLEGSPKMPTTEDPNKPVILNILNSYTGFFDLFSELLQNSLDSTQLKTRTDPTYVPRIWVLIDMKARRVKVTDNGVGMDLNQFKYCFRPNVTFKRGANLRGNKGVGATYLAYGFQLIRIQAMQGQTRLAAVLRSGRSWAEDLSETIPRPKLEGHAFNVPELEHETSGASFEVVLGNSPGERPRDLGWMGARTAAQWRDVLRIKTPLGQIALSTSKFRPRVTIQILDATDGSLDEVDESNCEYYYPHEIPAKVAALTEIRNALEVIQGDTNTKFAKLGSEYKKLDCMWDIWDGSALLQEGGDFETALDNDEKILIDRHNVIVYGAFLASAKQWNELHEEVLGLRRGQRIMQGGLQIACDGMIQGEPLVIPLTSAIGYQANAHVIVHLTNGNPDMGRKVFQPEIKRLAEKIAVRVVTIFRRHLQHRKPEAGPATFAASRELHEWKKGQEAHRDSKPLDRQFNGIRLAMMSEPQKEQDVIALFHELLGLDILRGYRVFATSQSETYDSLYEMHYPDDPTYKFNKASRPLGVADRYLNQITEPKVLEYKYDFDSLIDDFEQEVKSQSHIQLVVCWIVSKRHSRFYLKPLLVNEEGSERFHFAATHQAFLDSSTEMAFEVIVLKDLLNFLADPVAESARQRLVHKDE